MNDIAPAATARPSVPPRTMPVFSVSVKLNTEFARRVYKRCFDRLKGDLYVLTVRTLAGRMDDAAKAIETIISDSFSSVRKDLDAELERSDALLDDAKLTDLAQYENIPEIRAAYSTPRAKEFLDLLLKMDQLLMRYDALWLSGHIETHQYWSRCHNWQRRLTKVANRLRELGNRTRTGLARQQMGTVTPASEPTAAVAAPLAATSTLEPTEPADDDLDGDVSGGSEDLPDEFRDPADLVASDNAVASSVSDTVAAAASESQSDTGSDPDVPAVTPRRRRVAAAAG